jgi:gluconolactonase
MPFGNKLTFLATSLLVLSLTIIQSAMATPSIEMYDKRANEIIDPQATINVLGEGYSWSEGPLWVEDGQFLLFTDVPQNIIYKYKASEGITQYLRPSGATAMFEGDSTQGANGLLLNESGELVMMQHGDRRVAKLNAPLDKPTASFTTLVSEFKGARLNSPNDGVFHSNGDLYFTDPPYGLKDGRNDKNKAIEFDGVYRLKNDGTILLADESILYPNGVVLSPDEKRLFVAASDRNAAKWYTFDVDSQGNLQNKHVFYDATSLINKTNEKGLPDGMVMHSAGYLFATGPGGVFIFDEDGILLAKIRTGKATANCTLSADEKTLYMTAHNTLMSVKIK